MGMYLLKVGTDEVWAEQHLDAIAYQIDAFKKSGDFVAIITSGGVEAGVRHLAGLQGVTQEEVRDRKEYALPTGRQHLAAVGTGPLIVRWAEALLPYGLAPIPIWITHENLHAPCEARSIYTQIMTACHSAYGVALINENDVVRGDEISFMSIGLGENDKLTVAVAMLLQEHECEIAGVLFGTKTGGYYTKDPTKNTDAQLLPMISYHDWPDKDLLFTFLKPVKKNRLQNNMIAKVCAALYCHKFLGIPNVAIARADQLLALANDDPSFLGTAIVP